MTHIEGESLRERINKALGEHVGWYNNDHSVDGFCDCGTGIGQVRESELSHEPYRLLSDASDKHRLHIATLLETLIAQELTKARKEAGLEVLDRLESRLCGCDKINVIDEKGNSIGGVNCNHTFDDYIATERQRLDDVAKLGGK